MPKYSNYYYLIIDNDIAYCIGSISSNIFKILKKKKQLFDIV